MRPGLIRDAVDETTPRGPRRRPAERPRVEGMLRVWSDTALIGTTVGWAALVFAAPMLAQLALGGLSAFGVSGDTFYNFSDYTTWLPVSAEAARGNVLPADPSLGSGTSELQFYPYLALWAHSLFIAAFGIRDSYLIGQVIFPTASFALATLIYRQFVPLRWAIALSAVGLVAFSSLPLRDFITGLLFGSGWRDIATVQQPDITGFPMPGLSVAAFLAVLYVSLGRWQPTPVRVVVLTALWALQVYLHLVNALIGLPLWFVLLSLRLWRRGFDSSRIAAILATHLGLTAAISFPAVFAYVDLLSGTGSLDLVGATGAVSSNLFGSYYYLAYFFGPLTLLAIIFRTWRVDPYELLLKFWPVFLLMAVELVLVSAKLLFGIGVPPELISLRLGLYFLHMFYFVPVLYYVTRPDAVYFSGVESTGIAAAMRKAIGWLTGEPSRVYIPALLVLLSFYVLGSAIQAADHTRRERGPANALDAAAVAALVAGAAPGEVLVAERPAANLAVPLAGRFGTLWVNRYTNNVPEEQALERLALWARLVSWNEEQFVRFMRPPDWGNSAGDVVWIDPVRGSDGVGYWLVWNRQDPALLGPQAQFESRIRRAFTSVDVPAAVRRFGVTRVLTVAAPPPGVRVKSSRTSDSGTVYVLE